MTETHQETILRLKQSLNLAAQRDMFQTDDEITDMAYSLQEEKIAYVLPDDHVPDLVA